MIAINFVSSKYNDEERVMHLRTHNIELMINDKEDEVIEDVFQPLLSTCKVGFETSMKDSDFISDCVNFLQYEWHRINFKCGGSYRDSPDWIKKAVINSIIKKDKKYFQYAARAALNDE